MAVDGKGASLSRDNGTGYDAIGSIMGGPTGPGWTRETYDVTTHDSTSGWREFIGGLIDGGEVTVDLHFDPQATIGAENIVTVIKGDMEASDPVSYELAWPEGSKVEMDLLITNFNPTAPFDGPMTTPLTFKCSGEPTFTEAV